MVAGSTGGSLTMQTSRCPRCGDPIPGADINAQALVAVCRSCDVVHPLATTLEPVGTAVKAAPAVDLAETPPEPLMRLAGAPDGLAVQVEDEVLSIRRRWWSWSAQNLFLAFWVFGWDTFLVGWYAAALGGGMAAAAGGGGVGATFSLLPILFPILHVAVGVFMTYRLACLVLNKTIVTVDDDHLSVRHGPLPAGDVEPLPVSGIEQVYVTEVQPGKGKKTSKWSVQPANGRFNVVVRMGPRQNRVILQGLETGEQAVFIERRIEAFLGIANAEVKGEWEG